MEDPERYAPISDAALVSLELPTTSGRSEHRWPSEARGYVRQQEKAGELRVFDGKILRPPAGPSRPTPVSLRSWPSAVGPFTVCLRFSLLRRRLIPVWLGYIPPFRDAVTVCLRFWPFGAAPLRALTGSSRLWRPGH